MKVSLLDVVSAWENKFNETPSIHILNTEENTWTIIIRKRSSKRGNMTSFSDQKYIGVLIKALNAGNDKNFLARINPDFLKMAQALKDTRTKLNLSQTKFSQMLGVSQSLYSDFEHGKVKITDELMEKAKGLSLELV